MNSFVLSPKSIHNLMKFHELIEMSVPEFDGLTVSEGQVTVVLKVPVTPMLISQIEAIIPPGPTPQESVMVIITRAISFGQNLMAEFAAENVLMGITQDGMTSVVRRNTTEIVNALSTGSLYDAISEAKAIPPENKDDKYLTDDRLLSFVNKIEAYLGIPLSQTLN